MIAKIDVFPDAVTVHYRVGKADIEKAANLGEPPSSSLNPRPPGDPNIKKSVIFEKKWSSTTLLNGGEYENRTRDLCNAIATLYQLS